MPLVPDFAHVPFGDLDALERELRRKPTAAFIVEPIQGSNRLATRCRLCLRGPIRRLRLRHARLA